MKAIRIGLVGFGRWPQLAYAPLLKELPGVRVVFGSASLARTLAAASRALIGLPEARGLRRVPFFGVVVFLRATGVSFHR